MTLREPITLTVLEANEVYPNGSIDRRYCVTSADGRENSFDNPMDLARFIHTKYETTLYNQIDVWFGKPHEEDRTPHLRIEESGKMRAIGPAGTLGFSLSLQQKIMDLRNGRLSPIKK